MTRAKRRLQPIDSERFIGYINSPDPLTLIVRGHICLEAVLNRVLDRALDADLTALTNGRLDFMERVDLAIALGALDPRLRAAWAHVNGMRNRFAHQLDAAITKGDGSTALRLLPDSLPWPNPPASTLDHPLGPAAAVAWCMNVLWSSAMNTGLFGHAIALPITAPAASDASTR